MHKERHTPLAHPKYRSDLDGLRGLAILLVVCFHAFRSQLKGGFIGVDIFFVLSGYLISTIIFTNLEAHTFSFREFYFRRIRRIFPSLLTVLLACYVFGLFALWPDEYKVLSKHIAAGAAFLSNILLWQEFGYFDNAAYTKPLLNLWSLGIEEQFYILFPFLAWLVFRFYPRALMTVLSSVCFLSFYLNITHFKADPIGGFYSPSTRFWELIVGSLLAYSQIFKRQGVAQISMVFGPHVRSIMGFTLIAVGLIIIKPEGQFWAWLALPPTLGTVLIISAGPNAMLNRFLLSNKFLVWLGLISYPLYLWHYPVLSFARIVEGHSLLMIKNVAWVLLSVVLAWLTYKFIENPMRFGKQGKTKVIALCSLMIVMGAVGFMTYKADGFPYRGGNSAQALNQSQFSWSEFRSKACLSQLGLEAEAKTKSEIFCISSDQKQDIKLAIIGDSSSNSLFPGLEKVLAVKNHGVINIGSGGCPPFRGIHAPIEENVRMCDQVNRKVYDYVLSTPSIKTVMLVWGDWYIQAMRMEGYKENASLEEAFSHFSSLVQNDILALKNAGKRIVVSFDSPLWEINPRDCLGRPFTKNPPDCTPLKPKNEVYYNYWYELFKNDKDVCVFNQRQGLVSGNSPLKVFDANGILLFRDHSHLSLNGSDKAAQAFMASECSKLLE